MKYSKCICNQYQIQIEQKPGDFYDPEDNLPENTKGLKVRPYWLGCPVHNGHTNYNRPTQRELEEIALNS